MASKRLTEVIRPEGDGFVSFCPELNIASGGSTAQHARKNLREAVAMFFESSSVEEISRRLSLNPTKLSYSSYLSIHPIGPTRQEFDA